LALAAGAPASRAFPGVGWPGVGSPGVGWAERVRGSEGIGTGTAAAIPSRAMRPRLGGLGLVALLVALLLTIPVLTVAWNLFLPPGEVSRHLARTVLPDYLRNTLVLVLAVGLLVAVIGTGTAWLVTMCRFPGSRVLAWALILPLAVPAYVMAYTYTDLLQVTGPVQTLLRDLTGWGPRDYRFPQIRSLGGAVAMLAFVLYPYVYLLARAAFLEQSACALEAGRTLGCSALGVFWRIALPLARPAIVAGTSLALMEALADYGTVAFFGVPTFTTGIVRAWNAFGDPVAASQLAALLLLCVLAVLLAERASRGGRRFHHGSVRIGPPPPVRLRGGRALLALLACALPLLLGFALPAAVLLRMAVATGPARLATRHLDQAINSFGLAAITAVLAVALAALMAYAARVQPARVVLAANRVAALGYTVPGTVIAIGVLIPFAAFDNALDAFLRSTLGISTGLLLTGGMTALVFAYLVRFMAVSLGTVEAGLAKVQKSMDDAARNLGYGPLRTLAQVHVPLIRGSLLTAGLLVFVDVMKELPATIVMRPFNLDTLAVQAFNLAADERLAQAALPSLAVVLVGLAPVILLSRTIARGHARS
jgi:iron(III) transport system permease protein